jgi:outer membrane biosynthesis protein TonB
MYLAGILALCALLHAPALGSLSSGPSPLAIADAHTLRPRNSGQEPGKPDSSSQPPPPQDQSQPQSPQPPQEAAPAPHKAQSPAETSPPQTAPINKPGADAPPKKPAPAHRPVRKRLPAPTPAEEQKRKVVRQGSTKDPVTQLEPGMTGEQAARQRQVTEQLLVQTNASLQKLSGRTLTRDQQDTVAQIRKFMEQVKAAQAAGDLQRAYKLALKARLLADALEKS